MTFFPQIYALFCRILSRQTFTHFLKSCSKRIAIYMFKTSGEVKGHLNNFQKKCTIGICWRMNVEFGVLKNLKAKVATYRSQPRHCGRNTRDVRNTGQRQRYTWGRFQLKQFMKFNLFILINK